MRTIASIVLGFIITLNALAQSEEKFHKLLSKNDLVFTMPDDFNESKVKTNRDLYYNYAISYQKDTFEVRYTIFPLKPILKDYQKSLKNPNESALEPNKYHSSMFIANILNVSQSGMENIPQTSTFPRDAVKNEFGADYGATSFFIANSEFAEGYEYCLMIVLHKTDVADVYVSFLGNDQERFEEYMFKAFHSLRFKD